MNTANKLTMLRFALALVFVILFYQDVMLCQLLAFLVFLIAALTDFLDGYIARRFNQVTQLGKLSDPLADKVLVFSALILFVEKGLIWGWIVIIILSRDLMIGIFRAVAASQNKVIAADVLGKAKTVVQLVSILMMLFGIAVNVSFIYYVGYFLLYVALVLTVVSGVNYIYKNREVLEE